MKVRASIKKRSADCKIVRRKGRLYVINKKNLSSNKDKDNIMARIAGIDLPKNKRGVIGLTYIYGIGRSTAQKILAEAGVDENINVQDWNDEQLGSIRKVISETYKVEGALRSEVQLNIKRLMDIGAQRGIRHRLGLPLRGQRTKNNSRTRKGKGKRLLIRKSN